MKQLIICALLIIAQTLCAAVQLTVQADRKDHLYKCGETVKFTITAADDQTPLAGMTVHVLLTMDGLRLLKHETIKLDGKGQAVVSGTMKTPGFLRISADMTHNKKRTRKFISAGFDVEKISCAVPAPADFDKFWADALKKAAAVKPDFKMEKLEKFSTAKSTAYKVSVAAPGNGRIYGLLRIPNSDKPVPLQVTVPGAGPNMSTPPQENPYNIAALYANVHNYDPMTPGKTSSQLYGEINAKGHYMFRSYENLENNQLYNSIIGINRLIESIAALPQIDGKKMIYSGSSQGGGFGIILAGLVPGRFSAIVCNIPALCDLNGYRAGRNSGWPGINSVSKISESSKKNMLYYDAANFARRIKNTQVVVLMGFADTVCSPSSIRAMYNNIPGDRKKLITIVPMGHQTTGTYVSEIRKMQSSVSK